MMEIFAFTDTADISTLQKKNQKPKGFYQGPVFSREERDAVAECWNSVEGL